MVSNYANRLCLDRPAFRSEFRGIDRLNTKESLAKAEGVNGNESPAAVLEALRGASLWAHYFNERVQFTPGDGLGSS